MADITKLNADMIGKAKLEAEKEIREENEKKVKDRIKCKLQDLDKAKRIVKNYERELEDLMLELVDQI